MDDHPPVEIYIKDLTNQSYIVLTVTKKDWTKKGLAKEKSTKELFFRFEVTNLEFDLKTKTGAGPPMTFRSRKKVGTRQKVDGPG